MFQSDVLSNNSLIKPSKRCFFKRTDTGIDEAVKKRFEKIKTLFKTTGLFFDDWKTQTFSQKCVILLKEFVVIGIAAYSAICLIILILSDNEYDEKTPQDILTCNWMIQSFFSTIFLIYWQHQGYIKQLLRTVYVPTTTTKRSYVVKTVRYAFYYCFGNIFIVFLMFGTVIYLHMTGRMAEVRADSERYKYFGNPLVFALLACYFFHIYNVLLCFYVSIAMIVNNELEEFNQDLEKLGTEAEINGDEILNLYLRHIQLCDIVRSVDNFFEVYTFTLIGLNVPLTVFSLLNAMLSLNSFLDFAVNAPGVIFCIFELIGLTVAPAMLHEAIRRVEGIIYSNRQIWHPYNEKVYLVAGTFVSHIKQSNLGISLWGFALLTKPRILTTLSLTLTFLTFLLQIKTNQTNLQILQDFQNSTNLNSTFDFARFL
uniref:Gustatory receptor n=1 Tax=Panagrolaimus sp. JU765 TaxID=591449 RepID=A0AC34QIB3_9BILA